MPTLQAPRPAREPRKRQASATPAVPAGQAQEMLREIGFVLHATRVARRLGQAATAR